MERVVQALELHLTDAEQKDRVKGPKTKSLEAYDLVLQARKLMTRFDHKAAAEARDLLKRAIEIDPAYTEAQSLLGFYYFDEWRVWGRKRDQNLARALELATTAIELSPSDAAPHVLLALVHQWRREFVQANAAADKALALQPNDAITLGNLGSMLGWAGRNEEALGVLQQAIRLDPFHPPHYLEWLAAAYQGVGDYGLCVEAANRGIALYPDYVGLYVDLAGCYAALGREKEAKAAAAEILRTNPRFTLKAFAAYAPYSDQRDLQQEVKLLRKAGVPESADEVFRTPEGHMTGEEIRTAISGQTFVDTRPVRFAGTLNTFDPSGTMNGRPQAGSPAEQFGSDQGKWWIEDDKFCRKWTRWQSGRTGCFSFVPDGDSITWINRYGQFHSEMKKLD
jgi:tetratricopeptide (TPR) repeat protein